MYREFDIEEYVPTYFWADPMPLFVIIEHFYNCKKQLHILLKNGGILIGNLYDETIDRRGLMNKWIDKCRNIVYTLYRGEFYVCDDSEMGK